MIDRPFFAQPVSLSLADVFDICGSPRTEGLMVDSRLTGVASLQDAGPLDVSFAADTVYGAALSDTLAGVVIVAQKLLPLVPESSIAIVHRSPHAAFVNVVRAMFPSQSSSIQSSQANTIAPSASVDRSAQIEPGVMIGPGAVIGANTLIGSGTQIGANSVIGADVAIGRNCVIAAGTTIAHALIGDQVTIHPGCRIGQDGFGYEMGPRGHAKVPQVARVLIQNNVEIGANTAIDRGFIRDTVIVEGTKIDNLVQIAHNVVIGRHCIIVAQVGISGSVHLGDFVVIGGQVGIKDHVTIGDGAQIAATSNVASDVPAGARWGGTPAKPIKDWFREVVALEKLAARRSPTGEP